MAMQPGRRGARGAGLSLAVLAFAAAGLATARADPAKLSVELNKLEPMDKGCRVYLVTNNTSDVGYPALKLDLVLFQPDGVIAKRVALDVGPLKAQKRSLKLFDLDGLACERIANVLLNEVMECRNDAGPVDNCANGLALTSLSTVKITK